MNILSMQVGRDGCSGYRIKNPLNEIKRQDGDVFILSGDEQADELLDLVNGADIILFRQQHIKIFNFIKEKIDCTNKLLVVDMDDDMYNISPFSNSYKGAGIEEVEWEGKKLWEDGKAGFDIKRNKKFLEGTTAMLRQADMIICTTEELKNRLYKETKNKNIKVLPNAISEHWQKWNLKANRNIRIGWTGGSSHYIDWHTIKKPLKNIFKNNSGLKLVLQGCKWDGTIKDIPYEFHDWIDFEGHPYKTASLNLDIAIIPLADNDFNHCKSCIKWYEFSSLGIPSIVSDVVPYSEEVKNKSLTYKTEKEFEDGLQKLIDDKKLRKEIGEKSRKWVKRHRSLENIAKEYKKEFRNALYVKKMGHSEEIKE